MAQSPSGKTGSRKLPTAGISGIRKDGQQRSPDNNSDIERQNLENDRFSNQSESIRLQLEQAHEFRTDLFRSCKWIVLSWSIALFLIIIASVVLAACDLKNISGNALIALITATLANVFGMFYVVVRYAFRGHEQ